MFTVTASYIVSLFVSCIFFGISCATFFLCVRSLCDVPFRSFTRVRWILFSASVGMLVTGSLSIAQQLRHNLNAFVYYKGGAYAEEELNNIPVDPMNYIHTATYPIQSLLGDSVLIYRTYVVYNSDWRWVVLPILIMFGDAAGGFGITYAASQLKTGGYNDPSFVPWMLTFFTLTLVLNVLCTGMIIARIWKVSTGSGVHEVTGSRHALSNMMRIIIESGFIYTVHSFIILMTVVTGSLALYPVADSFIHTMPICFHLIVIRTGWHRQAIQARNFTSSLSQIRFKVSSGRSAPPHPTDTFDATTVGESGRGSLKSQGLEDRAMPLQPLPNMPTRILVTQEQWTNSDWEAKV